MSQRYDRRELLAGVLGLAALPRSARGEAVAGVRAAADLPEVGAWAVRALAALERSGRAFSPCGEGAACDLGAAGRLEVLPTGAAAVRVVLSNRRGELEILRARDAGPVARVEARLEAAPAAAAAPGYDTLRRVPDGFELTFSSALALRHARPRWVSGEPPAVYERLAAAAVRGARPFLG